MNFRPILAMENVEKIESFITLTPFAVNSKAAESSR